MRALNLVYPVMLFLAIESIPSLHSICTDKTSVIDDRIIGEWVDSTDYNKSAYSKRWNFERYDSMEYRYKNSEEYSIKVNNHLLDTSLINKLGYELYKSEKGNFYTLNYSSINGIFSAAPFSKNNDKMIVNLTMINGQLYADFYPWTYNGSSPYKGIESYKDQLNRNFKVRHKNPNTIYGHTFSKVILKNKSLIIKPINYEYIKRLINEKRIRIKHEKVKGRIIITATTEELRAFLHKYGDKDELFLDGQQLRLNQ